MYYRDTKVNYILDIENNKYEGYADLKIVEININHCLICTHRKTIKYTRSNNTSFFIFL